MLPFIPSPKQVAVSVLNALLRREDWAQRKIRMHAGKFIRLNIAQFQLSLEILPSGEVVLAQEDVAPNVTLTMDDEGVRALPKLWREGGDMDSIASLLHVQGEAGLAQLVSELAHNLRWDVEAELHHLVGPFMANILLSAFQQARQLGKKASEKGLEKTKAFLAQDYHVVIQQPQLQALKEDIQQLHGAIGQLEQRIQKLQRFNP